MQKAADSLILTNLSSISQFAEPQSRAGCASVYEHHLARLIVKRVNSKHVFIGLGDILVGLAEQAYGLRQVDKLEELSQALISLPLPRQYASASRYFQGLVLIRRGELNAATSVLEAVAADPPHRYTSRAIQSLGQLFHARGDLESALKLYTESSYRAEKGTNDPVASLFAQKNIAVIKSVRGDHRGALSDLERIAPFARAVGTTYPQVYYDHLNSIAVERGELGHLEEAAQSSRIAVASPFAVAYPEWRETFEEIAIKQRRAARTTVAVRQPNWKPQRVECSGPETHNVLQMPLAGRSTREELANRNETSTQARVLNFQQWKLAFKASAPASNEEVTAKQRSRLTTGEKLIRLMDLISHDETDDEAIDRILEVVEQIVLGRRSEQLD